MPRRQFIRELQEASEPGKYSNLKNVAAGEDDGTVSCTFVSLGPCGTSVDIQFLVPGECNLTSVIHVYRGTLH